MADAVPCCSYHIGDSRRLQNGVGIAAVASLLIWLIKMATFSIHLPFFLYVRYPLVIYCLIGMTAFPLYSVYTLCTGNARRQPGESFYMFWERQYFAPFNCRRDIVWTFFEHAFVQILLVLVIDVYLTHVVPLILGSKAAIGRDSHYFLLLEFVLTDLYVKLGFWRHYWRGE